MNQDRSTPLESVVEELERKANDPRLLADELERYALVREALTGPSVPYLKSTVADALFRAAKGLRRLADNVGDLEAALKDDAKAWMKASDRAGELEEALRPFGGYPCRKMLDHDEDPIPSSWRWNTCGECETCRARQALSTQPHQAR